MKTPQFPDKLHRPHETKAKSLSNRGSPRSSLTPATAQGRSNLNRRGRKTRTAVTAAEVDFCAYFVLTGNVKQASLQAGYSAWWGYELLKLPRIQPILREFEKRKKDEAWETAKEQVVLSREFLDELDIQRLVNMKTHPKVGDLALVKMFETGYKRTGDIQPARISAEAKACVSTQIYAKGLYLPEWRKEAIEKIQRAEREASGSKLPTKGENAKPARPQQIAANHARRGDSTHRAVYFPDTGALQKTARRKEDSGRRTDERRSWTRADRQR